MFLALPKCRCDRDIFGEAKKSGVAPAGFAKQDTVSGAHPAWYFTCLSAG
jgi:hypothetical protein